MTVGVLHRWWTSNWLCGHLGQSLRKSRVYLSWMCLVTGYLPTCAGQPISCIDIWCIIVVVCGAGDWLQLVVWQFLIFLCMLCWSPVLMAWSHCAILCLFQWLPVWLLCLCVIRGDLVHTTKVSYHVCTSFLACPLPWMGHLVVRQE